MIVYLSPVNVATFPTGGGHFWVYLQYIHALRELGCEVRWLEALSPHELAFVRDRYGDAETLVARLARRLSRYGISGQPIFFVRGDGDEEPRSFFGMSGTDALARIREADLLLNFHYGLPAGLVARFRKSALVDIDPGLFQYWMSSGLIRVAPHDRYFTTGETVGTPRATFPDCGLPWVHIRPPVCLDLWRVAPPPPRGAYTTISSWWSGEWVEHDGEVYDNNKRYSILQFLDLPRRTAVPLEIALCLGSDEEEDRRLLQSHGWRVADPARVASSPAAYRAYIRASRGEFSIAKPSCMRFQNAWVSDRTVCYLATGRPVVVQDTGPSTILPNGEGMLRFSTMDEAVAALEAVEAHYSRHCEAARALAEERFDARRVATTLLEAMAGPARPAAAGVRS